MSSSFAWLDFSDRDRQRAMDVVDLFREEDTRDELGIGVIRDYPECKAMLGRPVNPSPTSPKRSAKAEDCLATVGEQCRTQSDPGQA